MVDHLKRAGLLVPGSRSYAVALAIVRGLCIGVYIAWVSWNLARPGV